MAKEKGPKPAILILAGIVVWDGATLVGAHPQHSLL